uniref:Uncharacterized protein n=1 Tax=Anguilla anguilla TaxID=7936 RepID=A0A0E9TKW2_ANGAN
MQLRGRAMVQSSCCAWLFIFIYTFPCGPQQSPTLGTSSLAQHGHFLGSLVFFYD